jgi:hypothetical protein
MGNSAIPFGINRSLLRLDKQDPYLCLYFIMIFVRDQDRSLRFYVDQLSFRVVVDQRIESGSRWIEVSPPDGNANIALAQATPGTEAYNSIRSRQPGLLSHRGCHRQVQRMEESRSSLSFSTSGPGLGRNLHAIRRRGR